MTSQLSHHVTSLLQQVRQGSTQARQALLDTAYTELRRIAEAKMRGENPDCLLQPTVLVHEAYLKIFAQREAAESFADRREFFAAMARAMQQVLVDYARQRLAKKRSAPRVPLDYNESAVEDRCAEILKVHALLDRLTAEDSQVGELVRLRFFGGYTMTEAAKVLNVSLRTAHRLWAVAKARLRQWMKNDV